MSSYSKPNLRQLFHHTSDKKDSEVIEHLRRYELWLVNRHRDIVIYRKKGLQSEEFGFLCDQLLELQEILVERYNYPKEYRNILIDRELRELPIDWIELYHDGFWGPEYWGRF
jgi:hypothetical protein